MLSVLSLPFAILGLGGGEIILILFVFLLLFGAKRLPELARGLGKSVKEFKKATSEIEEEIRSAVETDAAKLPPKKIEPVKQPEHN